MATASRAAIGTEQINPNNREYTQVAAGLGNRSQIREELPLSTRVHELAKELGLKSQELLERIQKWGLDVKANALASLDPPMVDRIRELMDQPAAGKGSATAAPSAQTRGHAVVAAGGADGCARAAAGEDGRHTAPEPVGPAPVAAGSPKPSRSGRRRQPPAASTTSAPAAAPPQRLIPGSSPSASAKPPSSAQPRPRPAPAPRLPAAPPSGAQRRAPWLVPAVFPGLGPPAGPLSAHTPHRGTGPRPGGPPSAGARPATRAPEAVQPSSRVIVVARRGIVRLSTAETRRLHVVGGHPPDDTAGRPFDEPLRRAASPRWRARRRSAPT